MSLFLVQTNHSEKNFSLHWISTADYPLANNHRCKTDVDRGQVLNGTTICQLQTVALQNQIKAINSKIFYHKPPSSKPPR